MKTKLNILYVSTLCSVRLISKMLADKSGMPNLAAQKFHRLFVQGMALNRSLFEVNVIGVPEFNRNITTGGKVVTVKAEIENNVQYSYIPVVLIPVLKYFVIAWCLMLKIFKWRLKIKYRHSYILFDVLNLNTAAVSIIASKLFMIKTVAIVTDLPEMMYILKTKISIKDKIMLRIKNYLLSTTDGYVVLTEAMNKTINKRNKPYMIMEGLADINMVNAGSTEYVNSAQKVVLYSGGLYEKFGVKMLIDAFIMLKGENYMLHLYGNGNMDDYINDCIKKDARIAFFGYVDNPEIVKAQTAATVLVNPRFSHEEYTKFSFPSKTMEYMASGVPLLTTKLRGIPEQYFDYVYLFASETVEGYRDAIQSVLSKSKEELKDFGMRARDFVLEHKNNKIQAAKFYSRFTIDG